MEQPRVEIPLLIIAYHDAFLWAAKQKNGLDDEYQQRSAVVKISSDVLKLLGLGVNAPIKLKSTAGSIVVRAKSEPSCNREIGYMPYSSYFTRLASYNPTEAKLPALKQIKVMATPVQQEVTTISEILGGEENA